MSEAAIGDRTASAMSVSISRKDQPRMIPGRRSFFQYVDLGVADATNGEAKAQIMIANRGTKDATGWHYHSCVMQFVYVLKGSVDLQFADGDWIRFTEGDSMMIPGGTVHQERGTDEAFELLEFSVPAAMGTVPCEAPQAAK